MQAYADALRKSPLFYRAQRSGDLRDTQNPLPWRDAPSFLDDGRDVGVDLSRGYFDAGDYVKYGQPAAYSVAVLAWSGIEFATGLADAGQLDELKGAVRWGTDYILKAATHVNRRCTYYAQVGRGAAEGCDSDACRYDHGYWGRVRTRALADGTRTLHAPPLWRGSQPSPPARTPPPQTPTTTTTSHHSHCVASVRRRSACAYACAA
jgi:hypothetical protein